MLTVLKILLQLHRLLLMGLIKYSYQKNGKQLMVSVLPFIVMPTMMMMMMTLYMEHLWDNYVLIQVSKFGVVFVCVKSRFRVLCVFFVRLSP